MPRRCKRRLCKMRSTEQTPEVLKDAYCCSQESFITALLRGSRSRWLPPPLSPLGTPSRRLLGLPLRRYCKRGALLAVEEYELPGRLLPLL
jgi:hypothetical protein